jgi:hypothetical protein
MEVMAERTPGLWIGEDLAFPPDLVTETLLIIAKRGSGKSYAASVLVEEMVGAGLPVAVIDPIGVWWGLRSSADGQGPGLPVTILGGEHADLPLAAEAGTLAADLIIDERLPVVLDLSLLSKTQQRRFVTDFLERIYHRNRDPLHLVIDEADLYAPLRGAKESARLLGAYEDIVRRGRARGLGCTSITQRPAVLHTDIRSQAEVLIALRLIGTHDVAAIDEWVRLHATDEEARTVKASLPSLPVGTAWVWSPGWLELLAKVKIRQRLTFDSSATPKVGQQRIVPREFAPVNPADLERLAGRLKTATATEAPVPDVAAGAELKRLRAEVSALRGQLAEANQREPERIEVPVLAPGDIAAIEQHIAELRGMAGSLEIALSRAVRPTAPVVHPVAPLPRPAERPRPAPDRAREGDAALSKAQRAILAVLAQFPDGRTIRQISMLAGYSSKGGGFKNALGALRTAGLIERGDPVRATTEGIAAIGGARELLPTGPALADYWIGQLGRAEGLILRALLDAWPGSMTAPEIGATTGYAPDGGGFKNALGRLRTLQLIDGRGEMRADETLAQQAASADA